MKIAIVYFSQTGNTRKVAEAIAEEFEQAGHDTACFSIKDAASENLKKFDLIGLGTPTFESHAPTPVKDYIQSLPMLSGRRSFVFATCGGASGNVLFDIAKRLKGKGSEVIGELLVIGEVHHPAPCIVGKSPGRPNLEDLNNAKRFASAMIQGMGSPHERGFNGLKSKKGFYNLIGWIASSDRLVRFLEPKPKLQQSNCNQCQLCVRECPMDNISMIPYPVLGSKCIRCYRCLNVCENKALSANWRIGNAVVFTLWNEKFMQWFGEYTQPKGSD
jgi:flavodoxin/ferredoxin